jgi:hypothetical protein
MGRLIFATLFTISVGCGVGEVPIEGGETDGGNTVDGEASFNEQIMPLVTAKGCVTPTCHGGVQQPSLSTFSALQPRYYTKPGSGNILVTKGNLTGGVHQAVPYFDAAEQATVAAWIDGL